MGRRCAFGGSAAEEIAHEPASPAAAQATCLTLRRAPLGQSARPPPRVGGEARLYVRVAGDDGATNRPAPPHTGCERAAWGYFLVDLGSRTACPLLPEPPGRPTSAGRALLQRSAAVAHRNGAACMGRRRPPTPPPARQGSVRILARRIDLEVNCHTDDDS